MIVLGTSQTGRGPRVPFEEWRQHSLGTIWAAKVSAPPFIDHEPEWPDEENMPIDKRYYWRVRFDHLNLRQFTNVGLSDENKISATLSEKFQSSGSANGKGYLLDSSEFPALTPLIHKNQWIFQGNPEIYDVESYIRERNELLWSVRQHKDRIFTDDRVLIWKSGRNAGVIAECVVVDPPRIGVPDDATSFRLKPQENHENEMRCRLRVLSSFVDKPIPREVIKAMLPELSIVRSPQGTNFEINKEDYQKIMDLREFPVEQNPYDTPTMVTDPSKISSSLLMACNGILTTQEKSCIRLCASLLSKRFLIFTGLAGSGKTKLAQAFARWITPLAEWGDPFVPNARIESDRITYFVKKADSIAVEFWNSDNPENAKKVTLPREMIEEWANYISAKSLPKDTPARSLREAIKAESMYSDQLHSFETHLKAAAFALIEARRNYIATKRYEVVPVGSDWTGNDNILGYPDGLDPKIYVTKPSLDLILQAAEKGDCPHFLILDEMNLSHVERYFADILSLIESNEGLTLYTGSMENPGKWRQTTAGKPIPPMLKQLPENLFIIGTVNVDETTYMFSPKVLDRANVIEFRMDANDLGKFLNNPTKPDLSKLDGKGASFGKAFVNTAKNSVVVPSDVKANYDSEILLFFKILQVHGAEFGFRTTHEAGRFIHFYKMLGNYEGDGVNWFSGAFDCVVLQKLLPKLHGSRTKLGPVLKKLWFLCTTDSSGRGTDALNAAEEAFRSTNKKAEPSVVVPTSAPYPLSAEKIGRMWRHLLDNGFASFAEA